MRPFVGSWDRRSKACACRPSRRAKVVDPFSAEAFIGVPVRPFPRWLRCVKCGLLSAYDLGLFECKEHRFRPERTRFVHKDCKGSKGDQPARMPTPFPRVFCWLAETAISTTFLGTISSTTARPIAKARFASIESGASLQTENLWVKCDECGASRNMAQAFGKAGKDNLPSCRGRHPHLDQFDAGCKEQARAVLLGATNSWFPITLSALAIPLTRDPVSQLVQDGWDYFAELDSEAEVAVTMKTLKKTGALPGIDKHSPEAIWAVIQSIKAGTAATGVTDADIKGPEWEVLTDPNPPTDWPHFLSKRVAAPTGFEKQIAGVLLLERLREVNALLGFTRVEAPEETANPDGPPAPSRSLQGGPDMGSGHASSWRRHLHQVRRGRDLEVGGSMPL